MKMHTLLIRYMAKIFDPSTARFKVQDLVGEVSLRAVDVECILTSDNEGLSAANILIEEGRDIKDRVAPQFLSKSTCNIVIYDVIADIIKNKSADDDFLQKVVLVLLGTVIAPMSSKIVPKQYYSLVDDVKRISKINWNEFTLRVLFDYVRIVKKGKHLRQWSKGNLAVLQIKNNTTQEYRAQEPKVPNHGTIQKPKPKPTSSTARKSKPAFNPDEMMDVFMNRCLDYIHRQMRQIPDQVAQKLLEKLNKEGVMYKPAAVVPSYKNDGDDEVDSFENGPCEKKEFMYKEDNHSEDSLEPITHLTHTREAVPKEKNEAEEVCFSVSENVAPKVVADELTLELIGASVSFVEIDFRSKMNKGKRVYYNGSLNSFSSEMLRSVIDSYQAHLALRVGHDRHLCPAWRWRYLVDRALARDNPLSSPYNIDSELSRSRAVNRVKDEYTLRDKMYVALNVGNTHRMTVVMHMRKKEFQDRDLLYPLEQPVDTVKALKTTADHHATSNTMDTSLGWQQAPEDLACDNKEIHEQLHEIVRWFPSVEMMRNHALGLVKVMCDDEKARAFPTGYNISPSTVLLWAMREVQRSPDPRQRARWWMYRSSKMTPPQPDPTRLASRTEGVIDVVPAIPTPVNTTYWDRKKRQSSSPTSRGKEQRDKKKKNGAKKKPRALEVVHRWKRVKLLKKN
ncbi:hypothetical protein D1007_09298 [Hordeum vulgare]|nr:hypothetical protein D1007_09298 [Hordeum vulgare]